MCAASSCGVLAECWCWYWCCRRCSSANSIYLVERGARRRLARFVVDRFEREGESDALVLCECCAWSIFILSCSPGKCGEFFPSMAVLWRSKAVRDGRNREMLGNVMEQLRCCTPHFSLNRGYYFTCTCQAGQKTDLYE